MRTRIFYLVTILFSFIALTACAGPAANSSESELHNTESQITESETESEETQTQIDDTQDGEDADEVAPPDGVSLLSQERVDWFATNFFNLNENRFPNMFLFKTFDSPENVNIHGIFREGFRLGEYLEVSQEELELLQQKGAAIEWDTIKLPIEDMNAVLKKYVNLSLEETNKVDLDNLYYLDDYKAYYICVSDCAYTQYDFFNGWTNEDGTITLQYSQWYSQRDKEIYRVTLREEDGRYYFVSNMKE